MLPAGFWPLDGRNGDSDISEQVADWNVTSHDTTLASGVTGYPETAYKFNGLFLYINTTDNNIQVM